ncbi:MAG TPA: PAS domain-containing protein [Cytophagales bacterium]|nr:PAS domain-containing protein [Cytophagales bacterium]
MSITKFFNFKEFTNAWFDELKSFFILIKDYPDKPLDLDQLKKYAGKLFDLSKDLEKRREELVHFEKLEKLWSPLIDNNPDYIAQFDKNFKIIFVNKTILDSLNYPIEHIIGKSLLDFKSINQEAALAMMWQIKKVFETGKLIKYFPHSAFNDKNKQLHSLLIPDFSPDKSIVERVMVISREIPPFNIPSDFEQIKKYTKVLE